MGPDNKKYYYGFQREEDDDIFFDIDFDEQETSEGTESRSVFTVIALTAAVTLLGLGSYFFLPILVALLLLVVTPMGVVFLLLQAKSTDAQMLFDAESAEPVSENESITEDTVRIQLSPDFNAQEQIEKIEKFDLINLLDRLPYNGSCAQAFTVHDGKWTFQFDFTAVNAKFSAHGEGFTPLESFYIAKCKIDRQIREWLETRSDHAQFVGVDIAKTHRPRALIVDDDIEMGMAMKVTLDRLGYNPELITSVSGLDEKLSHGDSDIIFLDWRLEDGVTADQVISLSNKLITQNPKMELQLFGNKTKVVTYSSVDRSQIVLPSSPYFQHIDHWEKSIPREEFIKRSVDLLDYISA